MATAERPVLHASRRLVYDGRTRGAVHLYVGEDLWRLPFLAPRDPYSALYRTNPGRFVRAQPLALLVYDKSSTPVVQLRRAAATAPPRDPGPGGSLPQGVWTTLPVESGRRRDFRLHRRHLWSSASPFPA